jgi:predicted transcriptional regulator
MAFSISSGANLGKGHYVVYNATTSANARKTMDRVKLTVGGAMGDEASRRFVDAWHRAERGKTFHERHLAFESWDALARVLTGKRCSPTSRNLD